MSVKYFSLLHNVHIVNFITLEERAGIASE